MSSSAPSSSSTAPAANPSFDDGIDLLAVFDNEDERFGAIADSDEPNAIDGAADLDALLSTIEQEALDLDSYGLGATSAPASAPLAMPAAAPSPAPAPAPAPAFDQSQLISMALRQPSGFPFPMTTARGARNEHRRQPLPYGRQLQSTEAMPQSATAQAQTAMAPAASPASNARPATSALWAAMATTTTTTSASSHHPRALHSSYSSFQPPSTMVPSRALGAATADSGSSSDVWQPVARRASVASTSTASASSASSPSPSVHSNGTSSYSNGTVDHMQSTNTSSTCAGQEQQQHGHSMLRHRAQHKRSHTQSTGDMTSINHHQQQQQGQHQQFNPPASPSTSSYHPHYQQPARKPRLSRVSSVPSHVHSYTSNQWQPQPTGSLPNFQQQNWQQQQQQYQARFLQSPPKSTSTGPLMPPMPLPTGLITRGSKQPAPISNKLWDGDEKEHVAKLASSPQSLMRPLPSNLFFSSSPVDVMTDWNQIDGQYSMIPPLTSSSSMRSSSTSSASDSFSHQR